MNLTSKVREKILRLSDAKSGDVARALIFEVITTKLVNFPRAATLVEGALKQLNQDEKGGELSGQYCSVLACVADIKQSFKMQAPVLPKRKGRYCEKATEFAEKVIIPFEQNTNSAYLLSDLLEHLSKSGVKLKDTFDAFFCLDGTMETPHGEVEVSVYRVPINGNYGFHVESADSKAGHYAIHAFEAVLLQEAVVLYKRIDRPASIGAMFGGKSREEYEADVAMDSTLKVVPYNVFARFDF